MERKNKVGRLQELEKSIEEDQETLDTYINCTVEHKDTETLGDTRSNLVLHARTDGLHFELKANNQRAQNIAEGIRLGFFNKCSFMFRKTDWIDEDRFGTIWRTIKKVELYEICVLNDPAYEQTTAQVQGDGGSVNRGFGSDRRTMAGVPGIQFRLD